MLRKEKTVAHPTGEQNVYVEDTRPCTDPTHAHIHTHVCTHSKEFCEIEKNIVVNTH